MPHVGAGRVKKDDGRAQGEVRGPVRGQVHQGLQDQGRPHHTVIKRYAHSSIHQSTYGEIPYEIKDSADPA